MSAAVSEPDKAREARRRLRLKNIILALALVAFVVVVYLVSLVRMRGG